MAAGTHIIKKQILELELSSQAQSWEQQEALRQLYYDEILPAIEKVCDQYDRPGVVIRLDSLEIDTGVVKPADLDKLPALVAGQLEEQLQQHIVKGPDSKLGITQTTEGSRLELLQYYLQHGVLPWYSAGLNGGNIKDLLTEVMRDNKTALFDWILPRLRRSNRLIKRIAWQMPQSLSLALLEYQVPGIKSEAKEIVQAWDQLQEATAISGLLGGESKKAENKGLALTSALTVLPDARGRSTTAVLKEWVYIMSRSLIAQNPAEETTIWQTLAEEAKVLKSAHGGLMAQILAELAEAHQPAPEKNAPTASTDHSTTGPPQDTVTENKGPQVQREAQPEATGQKAASAKAQNSQTAEDKSTADPQAKGQNAKTDEASAQKQADASTAQAEQAQKTESRARQQSKEGEQPSVHPIASDTAKAGEKSQNDSTSQQPATPSQQEPDSPEAKESKTQANQSSQEQQSESKKSAFAERQKRQEAPASEADNPGAQQGPEKGVQSGPANQEQMQSSPSQSRQESEEGSTPETPADNHLPADKQQEERNTENLQAKPATGKEQSFAQGKASPRDTPEEQKPRKAWHPSPDKATSRQLSDEEIRAIESGANKSTGETASGSAEESPAKRPEQQQAAAADKATKQGQQPPQDPPRPKTPAQELADRYRQLGGRHTEEPVALDEAYIPNAGLVILSPFIGYGFKALGYGNGLQMLGEEAKSQAAWFLNYLVTGSEETEEEYNMALNKLLVGLRPEDPLLPSQGISDAAKEEANKLISSALKHWSALKSDSHEALRQNFLQRKGVLRKFDHGWQLQPEAKAWDVLMETLPWSLGMVRQPWMNEMIYVEW